MAKRIVSEITKKRMSEAAKRRSSTPEYKKEFQKRVQNDIINEKRSVSMRGNINAFRISSIDISEILKRYNNLYIPLPQISSELDIPIHILEILIERVMSRGYP